VNVTDFRAWSLNSLRVESAEVSETITVSVPNDGLRRMLAKDYASRIVHELEMASKAVFNTGRVEIVVREANGVPTAETGASGTGVEALLAGEELPRPQGRPICVRQTVPIPTIQDMQL
jgi:hypothetical protein